MINSGHLSHGASRINRLQKPTEARSYKDPYRPNSTFHPTRFDEEQMLTPEQIEQIRIAMKLKRLKLIKTLTLYVAASISVAVLAVYATSYWL